MHRFVRKRIDPVTCIMMSKAVNAVGDVGAGESVAGGGMNLSGARRVRQFKVGPPLAHTARLARRKANGEAALVHVQPFGEGRKFANSAEFETAWQQYEKDTMTQFTQRGGDLVPAWNARRLRAYKKLGKPMIGPDYDQFMSGQVPEALIHGNLVKRCKFGIWADSKGTGEREVGTSRYLNCDARLTLTAKYDKVTQSWVMVTRAETCAHNHTCDAAMLSSTGKSAVLNNPEVLGEVHRMMQARAPYRNICDTLATNFGILITVKQLANLKRDRLGGLGAIENLKLLLDRFASFPGSHCTLIDDQEEKIVGVVMQSASQRKMFERYGDNIVMDWTHNTNNLGFYLGSLMVTSVSGRGVSVCDFLCLEQTEAMMTTVFNEFIKANPGAEARIKSFVIDKDYKEWRVLLKLFPSSEVLLCQFHVVKWFAYVVTQRKYNLTVAMREKVLITLFSMVYARSTMDFEMHEAALKKLLKDVSPDFVAYLEQRWYSCRKMWSDCERARVFTALNTTSNRIESSWNQIKQFLGKKLRIDLCVEAIFAYQTAVMRREYRLLIKYMKRLILRSRADPFVQDALAELAEYSSACVNSQWRVAADHSPDARDPYVTTASSAQAGVFKVGRSRQESAIYSVDTETWSCSCDFHVTSALPCRHMMHVAKHTLGLPTFPLCALPSRWVVRDAYDMVTLLEQNANDLQTLRTALLLSDAAFSVLVDRAYADQPTYAEPGPRRVAYLRLDRAERGSLVVLNNLEKRNIVNSAMSKIRKFMMAQSTPDFWNLAGKLDTLLSNTLTEWMEIPPTQARLEEDERDANELDEDEDETHGEMELNTNLCDKMIADAIANEEESFFDAENEQITQKAIRERQIASTVPTSAGGSAWPLLAREQEPAGESAVPVPTHEPTRFRNSAVPFPARELADNTPWPAPAPLSGGLNPTLDDLLNGIDDEDTSVFGDASGPCDQYPFDSTSLCDSFEMADPPHPTEPFIKCVIGSLANHEIKHYQDQAEFPFQLDLSTSDCSLSSRAVSSIFNATIRDIADCADSASSSTQASSFTQASLDTSAVSAIMSSMARAHTSQIHDGTYKARETPRAPPKRKATQKSDSVNTLRDLVDFSHGGRVGIQTLHPSRPIGSGTTKKQRTKSVTGARLTYVHETSPFPVDLCQFTSALAHTVCSTDLKAVSSKIPCLLTEQHIVKHLEKSSPHVSTGIVSRTLNFSIAPTVLSAMTQALDEKRKRDFLVRMTVSTASARLHGTVDVDLCESPKESPSLVVTAVPGLKGFSEDHIASLNAFESVKLWYRSYAADIFWLENLSRAPSRHEIQSMPYLQDRLEDHADAQTDPDVRQRRLRDPFVGACELAREALSTCTLSTKFHVKTSMHHLKGSISVREIVGFLGRSQKLNDSVITYALRQMATDFQDVHVFDCLAPAGSYPKTSLQDARLVVFPLHLGEDHWGITCVELIPDSSSIAYLYDPLQSGYETQLQRRWIKDCLPIMNAWASRDNGESGSVLFQCTTEFVRLAPQTDGSSCGVYCVALAWELMAHSRFFRNVQRISNSAIIQMRVRTLWRIVCQSERQDNMEDELAATRTLRVVEYAQAGIPERGSKKKKSYSKR